MRIAFLNLCHCEPEIVARVSNKLTKNKNFDMYIHVDQKSDIAPFEKLLKDNKQVFFIKNRIKVYWGGYNAVKATMELFKAAMSASCYYDYYVILQNLDYPIRSNSYIEHYFERHSGTEFIRGCNIAKTKDWHFSRKYKIYNARDDDFYVTKQSIVKKYIRYIYLRMRSIKTIASKGIIKENNKKYDIHYGAAQFAVTHECAEYIVNFEKRHPVFNQVMKHVQFPDEAYFHTVVHNSIFKYNCVQYDERPRRWLVNWRNLHYFEFPKEVTVFTEKDYSKIMLQDALFIRKVRKGQSDQLMDMLDHVAKG